MISLNSAIAVTQLLSNIAIIAGIAFTIANIGIIHRAMRNDRYAQIMNSEFVHNKMIFDDEYRQAVVEVCLGINGGWKSPRMVELSTAPGGLARLYWAARAVHMSHLNLIRQMWRMCDDSFSKMRIMFPDWYDLALTISRELYSDPPKQDQRPIWYIQACASLQKDNFGEIFVNQLRSLTKSAA